VTATSRPPIIGYSGVRIMPHPYGSGSGFEVDDDASFLSAFHGLQRRAPGMDGYAEGSHPDYTPSSLSHFRGGQEGTAYVLEPPLRAPVADARP
jgi:hypothetical protein